MPSHDWIFKFGWIQLNKIMQKIQLKPIWIQPICVQLNWNWFNSTKLNLVEISLKTQIMLNPKENNIVFGSIQFNLGIWIEYELHSIYLNYIWEFEFNSNSIELHSIQVAWCNSLNIKSLKWNLISKIIV